MRLPGPSRAARAALAAALVLALAAPVRGGGGERFVLAWPPTRYESAELVLWLDDATSSPVQVRVRGRGIDALVEVGPAGAARIPLPREARCLPGVDDCALEAIRVAGDAAFSALLQSPDTNGAADTLLLTAHDTVRLVPAERAEREWRVLSMPCAPASEMPQGGTFATIVAASGAARVTADARACLGPADVTLLEGQALTLACAGEGDDLSGVAIRSDAPVVVLSGNAVTTVPVDPGRGLSGDLVMDLAAAPAGPARFAALPLPRAAAHAGRGDVVRVVALEPANVIVRDDLGGERVLSLAAGESVDLDTASPGADLALSLEADASIAAWQVPKSRALRGVGDPAAIPLVPSSRFTRGDRFFLPDGYAEANVLLVTAEPGARVTLDGEPLALRPLPGGGLDGARVDLAAAPAGGIVRELRSDRPFGASVAGFGGYKAHGAVAADASPALPMLLRGTRADDLRPLAPAGAREHVDADPAPLLFWQVEDDAALLRVARCGGACCLSW